MDDNVVLDGAVDRLRGAGARFAYLFGSRAAGTSRTGSDFDVAAWFAGSYDWYSLLGLMPAGVDLVILNEAPLELTGRVAMEGRLLFEVDSSERVRWEAGTRKVYLDEKPRVDEARRIFLQGAQRRGRC